VREVCDVTEVSIDGGLDSLSLEQMSKFEANESGQLCAKFKVIVDCDQVTGLQRNAQRVNERAGSRDGVSGTVSEKPSPADEGGSDIKNAATDPRKPSVIAKEAFGTIKDELDGLDQAGVDEIIALISDCAKKHMPPDSIVSEVREKLLEKEDM
jgi:hypothetical protein